MRYGDATTAAEMRVVNEKLRKAIEDEGRLARIEGDWWQYSLSERTQREPSAVSLLRISRDRDGDLRGDAAAPGRRTARLSAQILERGGEGAEGAFGHLLLLEGRAAPRPERAAAGRDRGDPDRVRRSRRRLLHDASDAPEVNARTSGVYWRAQPDDMSILEGGDDQQRAALIAERLTQWKAITSA